FEKALAIQPIYVEALVNLGNAQAALGRSEIAIAQYDKILALKPNHVEALNYRGDLLTALKRYDEGLHSFDQVLELEPENPTAFSGLARCALSACDWTRTTTLSEDLVHRVAAGKLAVQPFTFLGYCSDPALQLKCATVYLSRVIPTLPTP